MKIRVNFRRSLSFDEAIPYLKTGDIALFRGCSIASFLISGFTDSVYTHVGIVNKDDAQKVVELVEFREMKGGRSVNLDVIVRKASGRIDIFRPSPVFQRMETQWVGDFPDVHLKATRFHGELIVRGMKVLTGRPYGWSRILLLWLRRIVFFRFFTSYLPDKSDDVNAEISCPVCSTAVACVFNRNGCPLIGNMNPNLATPSDISRSPKIHYLFTLKK